MKKKIIYLLIFISIVIAGFVVLNLDRDSEGTDVILSVDKGKFIIDIVTTGELQAKNSVEIIGPVRLREFRIYNLSIQSIVDEGTEVKRGQQIASLDMSEFKSKLQDEELNLEKRQSQFVQTQLDTALQLRQSRDELINLFFSVEEMQIKLEQSKFEPPATIKQAEIDYNKAIRTHQQAKENYQIKLDQSKAKMQEVSAELRKTQREYNNMKEMLPEFSIKAPEPGMVIYAKGWDGKPIKAGSQISTWNPVVATLPDLTTMLSKTYINEVDVRKIKEKQRVEIGLDAFPEKRLKGIVTGVANVGEQRPNSDAKVFEATIEIDGTDPVLRPAMTTSNRIIIDEIEDVLFLPLECFHSHNDSITFVYKRIGLKVTKQEVKLGATNANEAIVELGLQEGDRVYLSMPAGMDKKEVSLLTELDGKRGNNKQEELAPTAPARPGESADGRRPQRIPNN
ncbi:MAG: efflux RND transporter periplasmic adaptor subunit [Cyclobacteriaceae bacterium]